MTTRVVDVLVPVALDQAYSYRVPAGLELAPGDVVAVPLGARECIGVVWAREPAPNPRLHNRLKDVDDKLDVPPLKAELRQFVDWVSELHAGLARHGAAHGAAHGRASRPRARARRRAPRRPAAAAHDAGARARARSCSHDGLMRAKGEAAQEAGVSAGVIDGLIDEGTLETVVLPPEPVALPPDPDFRKPEFSLGAARRRRRVAHDGGAGRLHGDAARRRHRLRQDRSLFRGGGGEYPAQAADADPDAGDRAHRAVSRPLRRALRHAAGGMAFAAVAAQARAHLGGGRRRTKCRWSSARARRCFCLMPISA